MIVKLTKTNFESFIVIGVLMMAIPLIGSFFPDLLIMLEVQWDKVFAQASNDATTTSLQFSYTTRQIMCILLAQLRIKETISYMF